MAFPNRDVDITDKTELFLASAKHVKYLEEYGETIDSYEFAVAEYLRMSGIYWTITCLDILNTLDKSKRFHKDFVVDYVRSCQKPSGGFSPHPTHDENLPHTCCAIQVLATFDSIASIDKEACISYVTGLQQPDGSFTGDKWGEVDTRFSLCATACLALLGALDRCDRIKAADFIASCRNFDGGFGVSPGGESHGAMIYCCVGALSLLKRLDIVDADKLGLWLAKRQLPSGGLNGRPEKHPDVCYSWWILASLAIIGRLHWIDAGRLQRYILACQDIELGGIADRPGNYADPFHTVFGTAGLSLLPVGLNAEPAGPDEKGDASTTIAPKKANPVLCMAQEIIDRVGVQVQILPSSR
ncbi:hypothetical protein RvY_19158 [Ramazzottius varieornatus]|uniref:Geranylgeranyl transferase type-2 subunit beta n=1 Tax=Ramazzottius varieornatus TaxID=947166 RepID=A0A1D1WBN1_RAMVA|nr:hypothetical protein RvY_19158 [Ramazzottius varieornatus]